MDVLLKRVYLLLWICGDRRLAASFKNICWFKVNVRFFVLSRLIKSWNCNIFQYTVGSTLHKSTKESSFLSLWRRHVKSRSAARSSWENWCRYLCVFQKEIIKEGKNPSTQWAFHKSFKFYCRMLFCRFARLALSSLDRFEGCFYFFIKYYCSATLIQRHLN